MIKKMVLFILLLALMPEANADIFGFCFNYSGNYFFEINCDVQRSVDLSLGKTANLACYKGRIYYYYCLDT